MSPPMMKFSANSAAPPPREPPPGTIQTHIRWMPKGRPQSIQSQRRSSSPFLMQADLKMQYSSPAMATGKTAFLKNSLMASVLVIGGTSMYWFLNMADREIAEHMNMPRRTVNTRRQKAYRLLKELMGGEADD